MSKPTSGLKKDYKDHKDNGKVAKGVKSKSGVEGIRLLDPKDGKSWIQWSEEISSYVKANYYHIGNAFKNGAYKVLYVSTNYDDVRDINGDAVHLEDKDKEIIQKERMQQWVKDTNEFRREKSKVMGIILQSISAESKYMLESHEAFHEDEEDDPLTAFLILEETHKHKLAYISKALKPSYIKAEMNKCRQFATETLVDFKDRFSDLVEQYESATNNQGTTPDEEITMDFILKLDKRYQEFQKEVKRWADAGEIYKIPKTLSEAVAKANLIVNENSPFRNNATQRKDHYPAAFNTKTTKEHEKKSKKKEKKQLTEEDPGEKRVTKGNCFKCGEPGHMKADCPKSDKKKFIKDTASKVEILEDEDDDIFMTGIEEEDFDVDISSYGSKVSTDHRNDLILDSGANRNLVGNPRLLTNIKEGERSYKVKTASGILKVNVAGSLAGFGTAVFLKDAPNLISFDEAETRYKIDYKQHKHFKCLDKDNSVVKAFYKDKASRMYIAKGSAQDNVVQNEINVFVDTVNNRITDYSAGQIGEAKRARDAIRMLGFPGEGSLTYDIMSGGMINNPVTPNALKIAADLFGRDVAAMKGKMTIQKAISNSMLEVQTDSDQVQDMHTDVFEYEGQPCLLTVVSPMGLLIINAILTEQTEDKMRLMLEGQVKTIRSRSFRISKILVDPAGQFIKMSKLPVLGVEVYPVGPNAHVRKAERAIRTVKDRARAVQSSLPWKLPKSLVQYLLYFVCIRINQLARRSLGPRAPIERFMGKR